MENKELEKKVMALPARVKREIQVKDQDSLSRANQGLLYIKKLKKEIKETFRPIKEKAKATLKEATAQEKRFLAPLEEPEEYLREEVKNYLDKQERIRKEAEEKAQKEKEEAEKKLKELEDEKLKAALEAEERGDKDEAERILNETPEKSSQILTPAPIRKPQTEGIHTRTNWKFEVVDISKVPREYMMADNRKINLTVQALKEETQIPGIRVWPESSVVVMGSNAPSN